MNGGMKPVNGQKITPIRMDGGLMGLVKLSHVTLETCDLKLNM